MENIWQAEEAISEEELSHGPVTQGLLLQVEGHSFFFFSSHGNNEPPVDYMSSQGYMS